MVEDRAGGDVGTLRNWSLALTGARPAPEPPPAAGGRTVTQTATPNAAIRDLQTTTSTIAINDDLKTTGVRVDVNIAHTYASDLVVKLRSPQGQEVTLRNREGGRGNGTVSFTANPADFNGTDAKGEWTLIVEDRERADVGTLRSWSLSVTGTDRTPPPAPRARRRTGQQPAAAGQSLECRPGCAPGKQLPHRPGSVHGFLQPG
ncbi:proprotein convertase P-domain-containing protein [Chloracidobacterium aggregatum]|uniref:proprotein convertase P-domain-containing protein n=1 Tax=Chloracidobacterium aggregatum TaxID=2851959 RepID=UPI001B8D0171|nr:proprotein convertase P-domain-containing protein [Chloracidobacterium aggregatum]QUV98462.1 proprotein convertase P-domain-containing protein [Chloracidobacterium sp. E]